MSASASTITGVELPSSSETFLRDARSRSFQPTAEEPVNVISLTRSSAIMASPISLDLPTMTFSHPAGWPASSNAWASRSADSGVAPAGLRTTAQPAANAGAILCATRLSGKLNGEIAPTTPIGSRMTRPAWPIPAGCASMPSTSPPSERASTAEKSTVCTARSASACAVAIGLPASRAIVSANSSRRSRTIAARRSSTAARSCAGTGLRMAVAAASIARRASSPPP